MASTSDENVEGLEIENTQESEPSTSHDNAVGVALRNAFQATVEEDVPDELLALLRRLD